MTAAPQKWRELADGRSRLAFGPPRDAPSSVLWVDPVVIPVVPAPSSEVVAGDLGKKTHYPCLGGQSPPKPQSPGHAHTHSSRAH